MQKAGSRPAARWTVLILFWLMLFTATSLPGNWLGWTATRVKGSDKVAHLLGYAMLAGLLCWAREKDSKVKSGRLAVGSILVAILYGSFDEWHQQFIPMRAMDVADFLVDALGAFLGGFAWLVFRRPMGPGRSPVPLQK